MRMHWLEFDSMVEFADNSSINKFVRHSPFEIVHLNLESETKCNFKVMCGGKLNSS